MEELNEEVILEEIYEHISHPIIQNDDLSEINQSNNQISEKSDSPRTTQKVKSKTLKSASQEDNNKSVKHTNKDTEEIEMENTSNIDINKHTSNKSDSKHKKVQIEENSKLNTSKKIEHKETILTKESMSLCIIKRIKQSQQISIIEDKKDDITKINESEIQNIIDDNNKIDLNEFEENEDEENEDEENEEFDENEEDEENEESEKIDNNNNNNNNVNKSIKSIIEKKSSTKDIKEEPYTYGFLIKIPIFQQNTLFAEKTINCLVISAQFIEDMKDNKKIEILYKKEKLSCEITLTNERKTYIFDKNDTKIMLIEIKSTEINDDFFLKYCSTYFSKGRDHFIAHNLIALPYTTYKDKFKYSEIILEKFDYEKYHKFYYSFNESSKYSIIPIFLTSDLTVFAIQFGMISEGFYKNKCCAVLLGSIIEKINLQDKTIDDTGNLIVSWKNNGVYDGYAKIIYKNGNKYYGNLKNNKFNGNGVLYYSTGGYYIGQWKEGVRNGFAKQIFSNGDLFAGKYNNGLKEGKGYYKYSDGDKYYGEYKNDLKHGEGTFVWSSGTTYKGNWKYDNRHGFGKQIWPSGDKYKGYFKNHKFHGDGIYFFKNKDKYVGNFDNNLMNGFGTMYFANGDCYKGNFKDNKIEGEGSFTFSSNGQEYKGNFRNGKMHGYGKLYDKFQKLIEEGEWEDGYIKKKSTINNK